MCPLVISAKTGRGRPWSWGSIGKALLLAFLLQRRLKFLASLREASQPSTPEKSMSKSLSTSVKETLGFEKVSSLEELFIEQLQDLYSAETQLIKTLPKMAEAAHSSELKKGFRHHLEQPISTPSGLNPFLSTTTPSQRARPAKP